MIQIYICTVIMGILLLMLTKTYQMNNTNRFMDKIFLYMELNDDDSPVDVFKFVLGFLLPIINLITIGFISFILFADYDKFEKFVRWMFSEGETE